jgi:hypothetical protein
MAEKALRPDDSQYYSKNREKFIAEFDQTRKAVFDYVSNRSSAEIAEKICKETAEKFEELLPDLPYVGGDINPGTKFIVLACQWLTFFKSMAKLKYGAPEVGRMMVEIREDQLKKMPEEEVKMVRALTFDNKYIDLMRDWTRKTPIFKKDWTAEFVEGDEETFDYGIDYRSCPCLEFFKAHDAEQFAPYYCLLDFPEAKLMNRGFFRTKTLAKGDDVCNFRYKKGKEDLQDWKIEINKF